MKVTPIEIRQKQFEKKLRGYDKDEVNAFLTSLSQEWERVLDETKTLRIKLEASQKEVEKLREVESSLFKTLKTAEDTGANMIDQANKAAELHLKEAQINAEALMNDAKSKAKGMVEKAELETREIIEEMEDEVKKLEMSFKTLDNQKENLLTELKNLGDDIVEKTEKFEKKGKEISIDQQLKKSREFTRQMEEDFESTAARKERRSNAPVEISRPMRSPEASLKKVNEENEEAKPSSNGSGATNVTSEDDTRKEPNTDKSFFDELS
ncbi:MAG: DivIVA domain-containing protein [Cyclobacteriaceae bacterium]